MCYIYYIPSSVFSGFISVCPEGVMNRENILDMYAMPRHRAKLFANQIFKLFDKEGSGIINFRVTWFQSINGRSEMKYFQQFVLATNMTSCNSPEDKLRRE